MTIDCRSALYMPASKQRLLAKGPLLAADAIIIDLEDSVAPDSKDTARAQAVSALTELNYGYRLRALRINALDTVWHDDDVSSVVNAQPDAVVLPKVESANDIRRLSAALDRTSAATDVGIWAMMESPMAVINAVEIAASVKDCPRLQMLLTGNNDLASASGMPVTADRTALMPWLMSFVAAAKAYSLTILDGVYNHFTDMDGFRAECHQGVLMGMDGKTLIHPDQLSVANEIFAPSAEAVAQAKAVVDAFALPENAQAGVLQINGEMVERLHMKQAEALLARAQRLSLRE